jgi:hypothetical protein
LVCGIRLGQRLLCLSLLSRSLLCDGCRRLRCRCRRQLRPARLHNGCRLRGRARQLTAGVLLPCWELLVPRGLLAAWELLVPRGLLAARELLTARELLGPRELLAAGRLLISLELLVVGERPTLGELLAA